jgi:deoxyribodipyrimidine photolyase
MSIIVWFRQDLRTRDNPALAAAAARGPVLPIFILADSEDDERVTPQPGNFYGGWISSDVVGPFKGALGTSFW